MIVWSLGVSSISLAMLRLSRMKCGMTSQSSSRVILVKSAFIFFSICVRRPKPGGVTIAPFGFWSRNLLSAISWIEGISVWFSAGMNTIRSFRPFRCSGK